MHGLRSALVVGSLALVAPAAADAQAVTLSYELGGYLRSDDNLFHLMASSARMLPHQGGERAASGRAALGVQGNTGALAFSASGALQRTWFAHNDYLNNTGFDLAADARYETPMTGVDLTGRSTRRLSSFDDIRGTERSVQTLSRATATISQAFVGNLRAIGSLFVGRNRNTGEALVSSNYNRIGGSAGVGYYSPAGNILAVLAETSRTNGLGERRAVIGSMPIIYQANHTDKSLLMRLLWAPSVLIRLDGRVGYTWHNDQSGVARDFRGLTGDMAVQWSPFRNLSSRSRVSRRFESDTGVFSNGIRESIVSETLTKSFTDTLSISLQADRLWRHFRYDFQQADPRRSRNERRDIVEAAIQYRLLGNLQLELSGQREHRSSSIDTYDFSSSVFALSATFAFGMRHAPDEDGSPSILPKN